MSLLGTWLIPLGTKQTFQSKARVMLKTGTNFLLSIFLCAFLSLYLKESCCLETWFSLTLVDTCWGWFMWSHGIMYLERCSGLLRLPAFLESVWGKMINRSLWALNVTHIHKKKFMASPLQYITASISMQFFRQRSHVKKIYPSFNMNLAEVKANRLLCICRNVFWDASHKDIKNNTRHLKNKRYKQHHVDMEFSDQTTNKCLIFLICIYNNDVIRR